jgi:hypothetical protein
MRTTPADITLAVHGGCCQGSNVALCGWQLTAVPTLERVLLLLRLLSVTITILSACCLRVSHCCCPCCCCCCCILLLCQLFAECLVFFIHLVDGCFHKQQHIQVLEQALIVTENK